MSLASNKAKGAKFETAIARHLGVERIRLAGTEDRGDMHYVTPAGLVVIECKAANRTELAEWAKEAEREAAHVGAPFWLVVAKRDRRPAPGDSWAISSLDQWLRQTGAAT